MNSVDPTSNSTPGRRMKSTPKGMIALLLVIIAAGIITILWTDYVRVSAQSNTELNLRTSGFGTPVTHKLDARFRDADGDLVADPPADPAQFIGPPVIRFAYIEEDDAAKQRTAWQPFMDYLSKALGRPVEYQMLVGSDDLLK